MNDKTTTHRDNNDSNLRKRQSANSSTMKKEVFIIGDSMIIYVNEREVSCKNSVKVGSLSGSTKDDFINYIQPTVYKKT